MQLVFPQPYLQQKQLLLILKMINRHLNIKVMPH